MTSRQRAFWQFGIILVTGIALVAFFPRAARFVEMAARELRHLWWLILLLAIGVWLVWGVGRRPKE